MKKNDPSKHKPLLKLELKFKALISHDKDFLLISRDFIERTLKDLYYLRTVHKDLSSKEDELHVLKSEYQIMAASVQNKDYIIKTFESTYMDKINDLKAEIERHQQGNSQIESELRIRIKELEAENSDLKKEIDVVRCECERKDSELNELAKLRLQLEERRTELESIRQFQPIELKSFQSKWPDIAIDVKFRLILQSRIGTAIFNFLKPKDLFALSLSNKALFFWFFFNGVPQRTALRYSDRQAESRIKELKFRLGYFQRLSEQTPDEFVKSAIIRFVCLKEKIGDYMTGILHEAQKLAYLPKDDEAEKNKLLKVPKPVIKIEKPSSSQLDAMNQMINRLFPNMGCFLRGELFHYVTLEAKEMVSTAFEKAQEIFASMKAKYSELAEPFLKSFAKLLVFGALLLQDAKQMEYLKDYMVANYQQTFTDLEALYGRFDDLREELKTKEFISQRLRELEKKLHESDSKVIKLVDEAIVLRQRLKESEETRVNEQKELSLKDRQVKVLGSELKQSRIKIEAVKNEMKELIESCLDIKILFERLDLNI